jgi:hypothetical protein
MRSLTSGILAAAALCLGAFTHSQARAETGCPGTLDVQQRAEPPAGWSVSYSEQPPRLSGVTLYDGPPANRVSIKYNYRKQARNELILHWDLIYSPRSHYLQCSYERTSAQIAMPLPAGVRGCEVVYDRLVSYPGAGMAIKRMVCK